jgi:hypothetical protein
VVVLLVLCSHSFAQGTKPSSRPGGEIVPPARRDVPGKRITLSTGELFVPDFFHTDASPDLVVWFLGAPWCAEQVFYDAGKNAVLLAVNAATLKRGFPVSGDFDKLLAEAAAALKQAGVSDKGVGKIALVSFSGGWTGVYEVLKHPDLARRIDNVVLLDSLYARDKASGKIDQEAIAPFLAFARRASEGDAVFVFTQHYPPEERYRTNTTTVCASYLIDHLGLEQKSGEGDGKILYRADKANCHILGRAGMTNQDHFNHFYDAAEMLKLMSLEDAAGQEPRPPERGAKN